MSYQVITFKKRSLLQQLRFTIHYYYLNAKISVKYWAKGCKMLLFNETLWCYDYSSKRLLILNGLEYMKNVRVDLDEVIYLNTKHGVTRAEKF